MSLKKMSDIDLHQKRVLIREDLNVPLDMGKITNDERIQRALPTIKAALKQNAAVMVVSHLGRPQEGSFDPQYSLAPVAKRLSELLGQEVSLIKEWRGGVDVSPGQVLLLENVRFNQGEKTNFADLAKQYASLCDVFVMDAFATAHRAQASTVGVAEYSPVACAGPLLVSELEAIDSVMKDPKHPVVAIVGGSKVSTKIALLKSLLDKVDVLIVGGGIANTFLKAKGVNVGTSLYEPDWVDSAKTILKKAAEKKVSLPLPVDVVVAKRLSKEAQSETRSVEAVQEGEGIFDIGPKTETDYAELIKSAGTIIWNGPVGVFEIEQFSHGTKALALAVASSNAYSLAGGGDTLAALSQFGIQDKISYISTGGGAFLAFLEGHALPAVAALQS